MSFEAKRELLLQTAGRYREASRARRSVILGEFVAATGYARKYAIRLLANPSVPYLALSSSTHLCIEVGKESWRFGIGPPLSHCPNRRTCLGLRRT